MSNGLDVLVKFAGGECYASSCGSKNPSAAKFALAMLDGLNKPLEVEQHVGHAVGDASAQIVHMAEGFAKSMQHKGK